METEDAANILLEFGKGTRGNLSVSQMAAGRKNTIRIELYGTRASPCESFVIEAAFRLP